MSLSSGKGKTPARKSGVEQVHRSMPDFEQSKRSAAGGSTNRRKTSRIWVEPQDFRDLRRSSGMTRREAAKALDVTGRTIQNWETGGARIPWLAFRMLRILQGCALPGKDWEGWTVHGDTLTAPNGRHFTANELQHIEQIFGMARLWRQTYSRKAVRKAAAVLPFPGQAQDTIEPQQSPQGHLKLIGGAS